MGAHGREEGVKTDPRYRGGRVCAGVVKLVRLYSRGARFGSVKRYAGVHYGG